MTVTNNGVFGEEGLFNNEAPRTHTSVAKTDVILLRLLRKDFKSFLKVAPVIRQELENTALSRKGMHTNETTSGFLEFFFGK